MKRIVTLFLLAGLFQSCDRCELLDGCSTVAVVRDLTGLDGCGYVFELQDGTRLIPAIQFFCGTLPLPKEVTQDPLYNFEYVDGKRVSLSYEQVNNQANNCMAGAMVRITCLQELSPIPEY